MYPNLELEIFKSKLGRRVLAKRCGLSESALRNKIKGRSDFSVAEAKALLEIFSGCDWSYLFARENEAAKL